VFSDSDGHYFRLIDAGDYKAVFSAPGYKYKIVPVSVDESGAATLNVKLSQDFELQVFPNPFKDEIKLNFPYSGFMLYITVMDIAGRNVKMIQYPVRFSGENIIPIRSLAPGYYIFHMSYNNQTWQFKVIRSQD
jgi:hypothetical protein